MSSVLRSRSLCHYGGAKMAPMNRWQRVEGNVKLARTIFVIKCEVWELLHSKILDSFPEKRVQAGCIRKMNAENSNR
jgi:hypothetical protein